MFRYFFCALLLVTVAARGQQLDSLTLSKMRLNFIVPDMPAFKSLGTGPSNLLRPSTPMPVAVAMSEFFQGDKIIIPRAFALEIAPAQLLNAKTTVVQLDHRYKQYRTWHSFRVSLGSSRDTTLGVNARKLALGFRINIIDDGDMATDRKALQQIIAALGELRLETRAIRKAFAAKNLESVKEWALAENPGDSTIIRAAAIPDQLPDWDYYLHKKIKTDSSWAKAYDQYVYNAKAPEFDAWFANFKKDYKRENWNADKLDFALAVMGASRDSMIGNIRFAQVGFWSTYALRTGKNGQTLFGVNAGISTDTVLKKDATNYFNISVPVRYVMGTNRVKGFGEFQYQYRGRYAEHHSFLNLGAEFNPVDGLWLNFYGGVDHNFTAGKGSFVTNLDIKITLPEKFGLF
ncbi:hypothetical protein SAMN05444266_110170 [Chitinophaga jiangningensis]|uniref:Uncharacterized protein n=1 Tax=Chitinophaga jiangningensis TaxID=1419482 RepID=A0A1M7L6K3_9BACT|nr:hypothetical protein [Chitinophaga jiangningensis]SHM73757.1 hypothetical protein SAMN05444266_110170 [Chitinophaga jiangningensis]